MTPDSPRRVIIAPDSFKGSLSARDAAAAIARGWTSVRPADHLILLPQADGGEGTLDAIETAIGGSMRRSAGRVTGPDGRPATGEWLLLPDGTGVIELAQSSGLPLMAEPDALGATTRGLGEVIRSALDDGATSLIIGLGGSASTDGGEGALAALGFDPDHPHTLIPPPPGGVTLLVDVDAPLLGPRGAARTFGPQKGADLDQVLALERRLERWAQRIGGEPDAAGAGAAGGTAFGFATLWGGQIVSGAEHVAAVTGLRDALASAELVITGEGRFDATSLGGKVVGSLMTAARTVPVGVIAGAVAEGVAGPAWTLSLTELAGGAGEALRNPSRWLEQAGRVAASRAT